jgi:hypothetical protein
MLAKKQRSATAEINRASEASAGSHGDRIGIHGIDGTIEIMASTFDRGLAG